MNVGDLVWCVYHLYALPRQGIILEVLDDMDVYYVVLIGDETHTLAYEEVFLKKSQALKYQVNLMKQSRNVSRR